MEAVAAVGVASATVQFLDFSVKALAACKEIRDSSTGSTKANEELTRSVKQLKAMQKTLQQSAHTLSTTYRQLTRAIQDCSRVADELLQLLEYVREVAQKSLGTMRAALRQVREGKRIEKLQTQLSSSQDRFQLALTAEMRDSLLKKLEEHGQDADGMRSIILRKLDVTNGQIRALDKNVIQIAGAAQKQLSELGNRQQRASTSLKRGQRDLSRNIDSQFTSLSISATHQNFLDSLYFPEMFARQESMKKNLPGTYDWVFDGKLSLSKDEDVKDDEELRGRISRWLRGTSPASAFWISGKPGSGKSSLMSCIMSDKRTSKCLQTWTGGRVPYIFSFFFWKPGSMLQKTTIGFMRSMIWQLCKARPSIINQLISRDTTLSYSPWTEAKLTDVLKFTLSAYRNEPLFFVVDGLDECEDNQSDLLDELQGLNASPDTKVCISSRPEQTFCQRLKALPSVCLQNLNYRDISMYALTKLKQGDDRTTRLARYVASKAEGVFLWSVLVCDSLCSGLMAEDDEETLLQRLNAYPKGLDELFDRMFANLEEIHQKSLAFYFYAARQSRFTIALAVASQPTQKIESLEQFGVMCEHEVTRVTQQSKGLLQVGRFMNMSFRGHYNRAWSLKDMQTGSPILYPAALRLAKKYLYLEIKFVHRSAYDYVFKDTGTVRASWLKPVDTNAIIRKVLNGALWLFQYGPILHLVDKQLRSSNGLKLMIEWALSADDRRLAEQEWFCHELENLVDLLQAWTSAVKADDQMSRELTLLQFNSVRPPDLQYPLREFWSDSLHLSPDFVASHSSRLWDRDDAHLNVAALFNSWSDARYRSNRYKRSVDSAMSSVATQFRRRGLPRVETTSPQMKGGRYSMIKKSHLPQNEAEFISWQALSTNHEGSYAFKLRETAGQITKDDTRFDPDQTRTDSFPPDPPSDLDKSMDIEILETFCALVQGWRIWCGRPHYVQEIPLPLQLSVPMLNKYPPTSRYLNDAEMQKLLSCRAERRLRLSCFARRGSESLGHAEKEHTTVSPIATYSLSSVTTNALFMFSDTDDQSSNGTRFDGSVAEISDCSQMVMDDIWDDAENQLTAWEKLYLRACVKLYFLYFWRRRDP